MDGKDFDYYFDGRHYDSMIQSRNLYYDLHFYIKQAKTYREPVLELACGTGRITIPIAKEGISITGLDKSKSMLDQARRKVKEVGVQVKWIEGDMTDFNLDQNFSLIIIPGVSMNILSDIQKIESCLSCVKRHLRNNGRFIFDLFNPDLNILMRDPRKTYPAYEYIDPDGRGIITLTQTNFYDKSTQISTITFYYKIGEKEIAKKELKLRMLFPQEIDAILHYNGLKIDNKYGNYNETPFSSDSNFQILVCQARE